jgi:hypothetical protein
MDRITAILIGIVILVIIYSMGHKQENFRYFDSSILLPSMLNNQPGLGSMLDNQYPGR